MKYIFVTGSSHSGIGKGLCASSIGMLLKARGFNITAIKMDPYLNIDASLLAPNQHGETFVLEDGAELDLDFGNYERSLDITLTKDHSITAGKIYLQVIMAERRGYYLSQTVQVIPHVTNAVRDAIVKAAHIPVDKKSPNTIPDIAIVEIGGTTNDIENQLFYQAFSQFRFQIGVENCCHVHLSFVPATGDELKSKPTQHAVAALRSLGVPPDLIFCRSPKPLTAEVIAKINSFCCVPSSHVISFHDVESLYQIPSLFGLQSVHDLLLEHFQIQKNHNHHIASSTKISSSNWQELIQFFLESKHSSKMIRIGIVGKYTKSVDAYLSLIKALEHAAFFWRMPFEIVWMDSEQLDETLFLNSKINGVIVPGGFGSRGVEGKIKAIQLAKFHKIPLLGICLGFQCMVISEVREMVPGAQQATSEEFASTATENSEMKYNEFVVISMAELNQKEMGGTMRLGLHATKLTKDSILHKIYKNIDLIYERHRHRYEINAEFQTKLLDHGSKLTFSGIDQNGKRLECAELPESVHPFFVGVQFHPEFASKPFEPAPLFVSLFDAMLKRIV